MAQYIDKSALVAEIEKRLNYRIESLKTINNGTFWKEGQSEDEFNESLTRCAFNAAKNELFELKCFLDTLEVKDVQEEPVSKELEEAADNALNKVLNNHEIVNIRSCLEMFKYGAQWKEKEMQSTIELAEDHAYFAGRTKTIDEIKEALLSLVLPCFMHGGEADEVVAKLDEVLNQKK